MCICIKHIVGILCNLFVIMHRLSVDHPSDAGGMDLAPSTCADSSTTTSGDDQQLRSLRSQIRLSEAFSGIKFSSISWEITHKGTAFLNVCMLMVLLSESAHF